LAVVFIKRREDFMRQIFKATDGKEFQTQEGAITHENVSLAYETYQNAVEALNIAIGGKLITADGYPGKEEALAKYFTENEYIQQELPYDKLWPHPRVVERLEQCNQKANNLAEKIEENYRRARMYGVLSCLDIIFLYDQPSMAIEIISQVDHKGLLKIAAEDEYIYLPQITEIIKEIETRNATP
jgi:hypothetical protein